MTAPVTLSPDELRELIIDAVNTALDSRARIPRERKHRAKEELVVTDTDRAAARAIARRMGLYVRSKSK